MSTTSLLWRRLLRAKDAKSPLRDLIVGLARGARLLVRTPDGILFNWLSLRNSPIRASSDRSVAYRLESRFRRMLGLPFMLNFSKVEIELTTLCNLSCNNCDRSSGQARSAEAMSVDQIARFISESIKHGKRWRKIVIQGGEPLLHPEILQILEMFVEYKKSFSPGTFLRITTNGWGSKVRDVLKSIPREVFVMNTGKIPKDDEGHVEITGRDEPMFDTYHSAPMDVLDATRYKSIDFSAGCRIAEECGIGLTRYGYFPCGAGASVARVFGLDVGVKSLAEMTTKQFRDSLDTLCRRCGHFKTCSRHESPESVSRQSSDQVTSVTWQGALETFKQRKDDLSVY